MYTGTMIDELIASVQKAEAHAAPQSEPQMPAEVAMQAAYAYEFTFNEALLGVA
jgi:hypothetical protein